MVREYTEPGATMVVTTAEQAAMQRALGWYRGAGTAHAETDAPGRASAVGDLGITTIAGAIRLDVPDVRTVGTADELTVRLVATPRPTDLGDAVAGEHHREDR